MKKSLKRIAEDERKVSFTIKRNLNIVNLVNQGKTFQEIGDIYKISRQRVHQLFKRYE